MVFTLQDWDAQSRDFSVRDPPTTQVPATTTDDNSIFGSGTALSSGILCLICVIYSLACCLVGVPIC